MRMAILVPMLISFTILFTAYFSLVEAKTDGYSIDLIHRDSPRSPSFDPHLNISERVQNLITRSISRANYLVSSSLSGGPVADILRPDGEFLMRLSIGTPPFEILGVADTGSDLIWTQCKPCKHCYEQRYRRFAPRKSSTYRKVSADSDQCRNFGGKPSKKDKKMCEYEVEYGDDSLSRGVLSTDKFSMHSTNGDQITLPNSIVFGCGNDNSGTFGYDASGIIGLGGGPESLISQMSSFISGKFSYCLAPNFKSSKMHFGAEAIVSGAGMVSTRLQISKEFFYLLQLNGISVVNKRLFLGVSDFSQSSDVNSSSMDIIIDTGTAITHLPPKLYSVLESNMRKEIHQRPIANPKKFLHLCYRISDKIVAPAVTFHFQNADLTLEPMNTFLQFADDMECFAFLPDSGLPIFGGLAQINFLVGYDIKEKTVSFKPTDCTKQ